MPLCQSEYLKNFLFTRILIVVIGLYYYYHYQMLLLLTHGLAKML